MIPVRIPDGYVSRILLPWALALLSAHMLIMMYHYWMDDVPWLVRQLIDLDEENNLPTWFSSFLMLNVAGLLFLVRKSTDAWRGHWTVLATGFFLMSVDEVAGVHETLNTATDTLWVWPALVLVVALGLWFLPFLRALPRATMVLFILAGLVFIGGSIGMEIVGDPMDADTLVYSMTVLVEESMEMMGVLIFAHALIRYLQAQHRTPTLHVEV
jgi:hypothetical protein